MDYKNYLYALILLLLCPFAYAGLDTDVATADVVTIEFKASPPIPVSGYMFIYVDHSDGDLKAKNATGDVVTIADF